MNKTAAIRELREAILRDREKPSRERYQAMIDRGVIDGNGNVLITGSFTSAKRSHVHAKARAQKAR